MSKDRSPRLVYSNDGAWLAAAAGENGLVFRRMPQPTDVESRGTIRLPANLLGISAAERQASDAAAAAGPAVYDLNQPLKLIGHDGAVTGVAFAPDGEIAATSGRDGTVRLWNPRGGAVDKSQADLVWRDAAKAGALAWSPDAHTLAVATADAVRLWNTRNNVEMIRLPNRGGKIHRLAFSPDGTYLALASRDWTVLVWDLPRSGSNWPSTGTRPASTQSRTRRMARV